MQQALHVPQCTYCAELAAKAFFFQIHLILTEADNILEMAKVAQQAAQKVVFYSNQLQRTQKNRIANAQNGYHLHSVVMMQ